MSGHGIARSSQPLVRSAKARELELQKIEKYNSLVDEVRTLQSSNVLTASSLETTSTLLSQNPEFNSVWNFRRRILLHLLSKSSSSTSATPTSQAESEQTSNQTSILNLLTRELAYLIPLLQSYPKCYWIWNYRNFLLQTVNEMVSLPGAALKVWKSEMGLVDKMLARDSRNFHGWGYRRFVVANIEKLTVSSGQTEVDAKAGDLVSAKEGSMVESEFEYTTMMIRKNMSNFSAWHNRSKLIPRLLEERGANDEEKRSFLDGELGIMQEALFTDPYDQSLHLYHHWLLSSSCSISGQTSEASSTTGIAALTPAEKLETLARTLVWMMELLGEEPTCRLLLEELIFVGGLVRDVLGHVDPGTVEEAADISVEGLTQNMKAWLKTLTEVDAMRSGRWNELADRL